MEKVVSLSQLDLVNGDSSKEMKTKKLLYEENSIQEYWIIDPEHENAFQFHLTEQGIYSLPTIYVNDDTFNSVIFPNLTIDLNEIFKP